MSVRVYTGPHADRHRRGGPRVLRALPWVLAFAVIGLEIAYALTEGDDRRAITIAVVIVFFLASTIHALAWRGSVWTLGIPRDRRRRRPRRRGSRSAHRLALRRLHLHG